MINLTDIEIGWLVGILEGEGTFSFDGRTQGINLQMCDEDIVMRYVELIGKFLGREPHMGCLNRGPNRSEVYQVTIKGNNARRVMKLIVTHMGTRRRMRIWQSLNRHKPEVSNLKAADLINLVRKPA